MNQEPLNKEQKVQPESVTQEQVVQKLFIKEMIQICTYQMPMCASLMESTPQKRLTTCASNMHVFVCHALDKGCCVGLARTDCGIGWFISACASSQLGMDMDMSSLESDDISSTQNNQSGDVAPLTL